MFLHFKLVSYFLFLKLLCACESLHIHEMEVKYFNVRNALKYTVVKKVK